jgi:37-kD nucleoid-associated bacterial protein
MIFTEETIIRNAILHRVDMDNDKLHLSSKTFECNEASEQLALKKIFLKPFANNTVTLEFKHDVNVELNVLFNLAKAVYNESDFVAASQDICKHLQSVSKHPNIKSGDVFVLQLEDVRFKNTHCQALGIFKVESKETFLETEAKKEMQLNFKQGIGSKRLDKACLILFTEEPYTVFLIDNSSSGDTDYWKNEFAKLAFKKDDINTTHHFLSLTKDFVTQQYPTDFETTKADQIDLLNRSVEYFKTHETFEKAAFEQEVLHHENLIHSFQNFNKQYTSENDIELGDGFEISAQAVKKQARVFKSVLKLDKNFHVYIHGNRELIEQGVDADGRKFYKLYFEKES